METRLYVDPLSQPSRACIVFCRANGLRVTEVLTRLRRREQREAAYRAINPLAKVPALQEGDWVLPESCAILRYLCNSRRGVADHWYPVAPRARARVDAALDWHHATLRRGASALVFVRVFAGNAADAAADKGLSESVATTKAALRQLETYWLAPPARWVGGGAAESFNSDGGMSIADLVLGAEVAQLALLAGTSPDAEALLAPHPRVRQWLRALEAACAPHWRDALSEVDALVAAAASRRAAKL